MRACGRPSGRSALPTGVSGPDGRGLWLHVCVQHIRRHERPKTRKGDAPIKVQHLSGREIGVNVRYLANPFGIKYKLNGFELGAEPPFQIR